MREHFIIIAFLFSYVGFGQQPTQPQDSITPLDEVIISDVPLKKQALPLVTSDLIGQDIIQQYSPVDLISTLNQSPGILVFSGAVNTNRITIRGIGARTPYGTNKLRMYYNNIPITNGSGFSELEAFDLENLYGLEIIKGPKSTLYGANLGGAMLLRAKEAPTNFTGFSSHITLGSFGLFKNTSAFSHKDAKWSVSMNYGHTDYMGFRENNGFTRNGYMLNTTHRPSDKTRISLFINHINYTAYIASSLSKTDFDNHPQKAAFTWNASRGHEKNEYTVSGLTLQHEITPNIANKTSLFYSYLDHFEPRPFNILDEFTAGYGLRTIFEGQFNFLGTKARYTFGSEWYKDEYSWSTFENLYSENQGMGSLPGNALSKNKEFRSQFNGFGSFTYSFSPRFSGELGISLNQTEYDFRDLFNQGNNNRDAQRKFDPIVLPNLNLKYSFVNGAQIFTNVSRGFSNPSLEETLTPEGIVNPEIAQEKGMNYELGTQLKLFKNKVNIELLTYRMNVTDLLISQRVGEDQYMGINAGKTRHDGVELKFDLTVKLFKKFTVSRFFNYTYNDHKFLDFVDGENDFSGNPLTGVPKHRIVTGMQIKHDKGLYAGMVYTHVGTMPLTDQNTLDSDAYNLVHAKIGYGKKLGQRFRADANFGINNFFNTHYASSVLINAVGFGGNEPRYYYPGAPRNFYGGLSLRYQL